MTEYKETVTRSRDAGLTDDGRTVDKQTKRVSTETTPDGRVVGANLVWLILGIIEVILGLRFILKLLGANPAAGFVQFIYNISGALSAPFDSIFGVKAATNGQTTSVFEPSILVAMLVYLLIAWGIIKIMSLTSKPDEV